jgi:transposase InsO family protein
MEEMAKHGKVGLAAAKAGMGRNTASKYVHEERLPSQLRKPHTWRTRPDPFAEDWEDMKERLTDAPELEAKALFEDLLNRKPDRYHEGQVRTFQRRVKEWRAQDGPPKEVFFSQQHRPGEMIQTDFTFGSELGITINEEPFPHRFCRSVLTFSDASFSTVCRSESMAALKRGVQRTVFCLGRVPKYHQTDNSTAATHDLRTGLRGFNEEYRALMRHLGMKPRTTAVGKKEQNGDIEASNGAFKRSLKQHLLLRGSRDFESVEAYEKWVQEVEEKRNRLREKRLREDLAAMRPLSVDRLPEYKEVEARVSIWSTIAIRRNTYSVPSRLIGEVVKVWVYEDRLEVTYGGKRQLTMGRLLGEGRHRINYRHVIDSLVRKPGAFARYRYRQEMFPTLTFRRAYDALQESRDSERQTDLEYLRILQIASQTLECEVEAAVELLLSEGEVPLASQVKELVEPSQPEVPDLPALVVDLEAYDKLLVEREEVA